MCNKNLSKSLINSRLPRFVLSLFFLLIFNTSYGQYQIGIVPRDSPDREVYQKIGYTEIRIKYGSPKVKGRKIWGDLEPFESVWRAGANRATTIEFSTDVAIEGQLLPKGVYAFFVIPRTTGKWTAIFNTDSKQWGAFDYSTDDDQLRIDIAPQQTALTEALEYTIESENYEQGQITLKWEHIALELHLSTNYLHLFEANIEERAKNADENIKWVVYLQGAEHLVNTKKKLELADQWISKSETLMDKSGEWNKQYYPKTYIYGNLLWVKAMVLHDQGHLNEALKYVEQMKALEGKYRYYEKKKEKIDALLNTWE